MQATTEETVILAKTRELCQTIIKQPEFRAIRQRVDTFLADDTAKNQYQLVVEKGDALQQKQQFGAPLDSAEITEFERNRARGGRLACRGRSGRGAPGAGLTHVQPDRESGRGGTRTARHRDRGDPIAP